MARNSFPRRTPDLINWSGGFINTLSASPDLFGATPDQCIQYTTTRSRVVNLWDLIQEPTTDTKPNRVALADAKVHLVNATKSLVDMLQAWPQQTDENRAKLKLHIRDKEPTPKPRPAHAPLIQMRSQRGRTVEFRLLDATDTERRGKPVNVAGATILSFVGDVPPDDVNGWKFEGNTTKVFFPIEFPVTVVPGTKVWITAVWYNTKGQSGPPADPFGTHIAGGIGFKQAA
jgi:hypothetical protein